jgi:hypothetical protein
MLSGVLCTLFTVMFAELRTPLLAAAAAVTTAVPGVMGAVKTPFGKIDPALADQTTAVCDVFWTIAVN